MAFRSSVAKHVLSLLTAQVSLTLSTVLLAGTALAQEAAPAPTPPAATPSAAQPTATTAPPASQAKENGEGDDGPGSGFYLEGNGAVMFSFSSTHEWKDDCPALPTSTEATSCDAGAPIGLLVDGRLGYRFGYVGIELMGVFAGDWSRASFDESISGISVDSTMDIGRVGGGLGAGLRLMTSPGLARISAGAGGGALLRYVYSTVSSLDGQSESYLAPYIMGDVTVTLLSFINIGVVAMVEFAPDVTLQPDFSSLDIPGTDVLEEAIGPITVFQGPQFFIGPRVGLHFGG